ncbi:MAG: hypothetical protein JKY95_08835 [Planctomycetaceae bacterium]|nr:hypothetical protein [Planctomycetaceae bacterium]
MNLLIVQILIVGKENEKPPETEDSIFNVNATDSKVDIDYLSTILEALNIEYPSKRPVDGISLMPVIQDRIQKSTEVRYSR